MKPKNVNPKNFETIHILYDKNYFSIGYGIWKGKDKVIAMRWNGNNDEDKGFPKVFGHPMWFVLPEELIISVLKSLLETKNSKKEVILNLLKNKNIL